MIFKVPAPVAIILDFKPGASPDREGRLLILGKRPDEAHHEVKRDARLIPSPGRYQDFPPGLTIPDALDRAKGDARRQGGFRVAAPDAQTGHVDPVRQSTVNELLLERGELNRLSGFRTLGNAQVFKETDCAGGGLHASLPRMEYSTYEFLKDFQSGIVSLLVGIAGFGGVILTLRANSKLAERQHERELEARRTLVKGAILAELRERSKRMGLYDPRKVPPESAEQKAKINSFHLPTLSLMISKELLRDVGLLSEKEIEAVLFAIESIEKYEAFAKANAWHERTGLYFLANDNEKAAKLIWGEVGAGITLAIQALGGKLPEAFRSAKE